MVVMLFLSEKQEAEQVHCQSQHGAGDAQKGGHDRYLAIPEAIDPDGTNPGGAFSKEKGLDLLETLGRRKWDATKPSDSNSITVWSSLYNLTDKTVTWISNEKFGDESQIFEYSL